MVIFFGVVMFSGASSSLRVRDQCLGVATILGCGDILLVQGNRLGDLATDVWDTSEMLGTSQNGCGDTFLVWCSTFGWSRGNGSLTRTNLGFHSTWCLLSIVVIIPRHRLLSREWVNT